MAKSSQTAPATASIGHLSSAGAPVARKETKQTTAVGNRICFHKALIGARRTSPAETALYKQSERQQSCSRRHHAGDSNPSCQHTVCVVTKPFGPRQQPRSNRSYTTMHPSTKRQSSPDIHRRPPCGRIGTRSVSFRTNSSGWALYTPPSEIAFTRTPLSAQYVARYRVRPMKAGLDDGVANRFDGLLIFRKGPVADKCVGPGR